MEHDIFIKLLNMSYQGGIVICFILLARYILHLTKAPKKYAYYLWLIAFVRLICPFSFESVLSILPQETEPIKTTIIYEQIPEIHTGSTTINQAVNNVLPKPNQVNSINPMQVVMVIVETIWLVGIAVFLSYSVISFIRLKRRLVGSINLKENIYLADHIETPFVLGVLRPHIYLPSTLGEKEMSYIVMHEQAHVKRKDHIIKLILFGITIIHWFNPLVWIAYALVNQDMEMSCDEYVINRYAMRNYNVDIRKEYATSLLNLSVGRRKLLGVPLSFGEGDVKGRIKNVTKYKKPLISVAICAVIGIVILAVDLLTSPPSTTTPSGGTEDIQIPQTAEDMEEVESAEEVEVNIPTIDLDANLGADGVILDYADDNIVIFHGYFGLFVYDLSNQKIVRAVDLVPIGCNYTQGDNYCEVMVSEDGAFVYLHPLSLSEMYVFHVSTGKLYKSSYNLDGVALFDRFADNHDLAGSGDGFYSDQKVVFKTNDYTYYGVLSAYGDSKIRDLNYFVDDMVYSIFDSLDKDSVSLEGVSMTVKEESVTSKGATIILSNTTNKNIEYGESYSLQRFEDGKWNNVPYIIENWAFNDVAYTLEKDTPREFTIEWSWLYGSLEAGKYQIIKGVMDFRDTGDYDTYTLIAGFVVE